MSEIQGTLCKDWQTVPCRGQLIGSGVFAVSDATYNYKEKIWMCLANVSGRLCKVEVNVTELEEPGAPDE